MESLVRFARIVARFTLRGLDRGTAAEKRSGRPAALRVQSISERAAARSPHHPLSILVHGLAHETVERKLVAARRDRGIRSGARARSGRQNRDSRLADAR